MDDTMFNFGFVDPAATPNLNHIFNLTNRSSSAVKIGKILTSCGCTTASLENVNSGNVVCIPSGGSVRLAVSIHIFGAVGVISKSVTIYSDDSATVLLTIHLRANVLNDLCVTPQQVDFGSVVPGANHAVALQVAASSSLAVAGIWPTLVSSNQDVRVVLLSVAPALQWPLPVETYSYQIILLPQAHLGHVTGKLLFTGIAAKDTSPSAMQLREVSVPLTGNVEGSIQPQQDTVLFGMVPSGKAVSRRVLLFGDSEHVFQDAHISCAASSLSARWLTDIHEVESVTGAAGARKTRRYLEVALSPTTAKGLFESEVDISLVNGETLTLPVLAYIMDSP